MSSISFFYVPSGQHIIGVIAMYNKGYKYATTFVEILHLLLDVQYDAFQTTPETKMS